MSRSYTIHIQAHGPMNVDVDIFETAVIGAIQDEWELDDLQFCGDTEEGTFYVHQTSVGNLTGGESPGKFTLRLATNIWNRVGEYVVVQVSATCMDDIPTYVPDIGAYEAWKAAD